MSFGSILEKLALSSKLIDSSELTRQHNVQARFEAFSNASFAQPIKGNPRYKSFAGTRRVRDRKSTSSPVEESCIRVVME